MHALYDPECGLGALYLFANQAEGDVIEARAAIFFRYRATHKAKWPHLLERSPVYRSLLVMLPCIGSDLFLREIECQFLYGSLLFVE